MPDQEPKQQVATPDEVRSATRARARRRRPGRRDSSRPRAAAVVRRREGRTRALQRGRPGCVRHDARHGLRGVRRSQAARHPDDRAPGGTCPGLPRRVVCHDARARWAGDAPRRSRRTERGCGCSGSRLTLRGCRDGVDERYDGAAAHHAETRRPRRRIRLWRHRVRRVRSARGEPTRPTTEEDRAGHPADGYPTSRPGASGDTARRMGRRCRHPGHRASGDRCGRSGCRRRGDRGGGATALRVRACRFRRASPTNSVRPRCRKPPTHEEHGPS